MSDKKHIDRLFQEKFKDFEVTPDDAVWRRIEAQLGEKKKRKVIPIWWTYAGVAATLLLLLTVGNSYFNNNAITEPTPSQVVDTEDNHPLNQMNENRNDGHDNSINGAIENTSAITNHNVSEDANKTDNAPSFPKKELNPTNSASIANHSAQTGMKRGNTAESIQTNNPHEVKNNIQGSVELANTSEEKANTSSETNNAQLDKGKIDNLFNKNTSNDSHVADTQTPDGVQNHLTIEEAIELAKNRNEDEEKENINRWSVAPNAAPVFFNSLGKGSSIDPQFNSNSKSSETNMSYGVSASYAVNNRVSVRSGINKVNLGYNTNNVVAIRTMGMQSSMRTLANVKPVSNDTPFNSFGNELSILSSQNFANKSSENFVTTSGINTSINQSLSFIEIPLEIKYLLSDKKLGVNVIGGFSSFFLSDNALHSTFDGAKVFIGEASNINKTSYSANLGFGLDYKVSKKFNLNLEPMFKYQINTFNNTSGDFKPYFIGVYTGFGFKF